MLFAFLKDHSVCSVDKINVEEEWKCEVLKHEGPGDK